MKTLFCNFKHLLFNHRLVYLAGPEAPQDNIPAVEASESIPSDFLAKSEKYTTGIEEKGKNITENAIRNLVELSENSDADMDPKKALETTEEQAFGSEINQINQNIDSAINNKRADLLVESVFSLQVLVEGNVKYLTNEAYDNQRVAINRALNKIQSGMRKLGVGNFDTDFTVYRNALNNYAEAADNYNKADEALSAYQLNNDEIDRDKLAELQNAADTAEDNWNKTFDHLKAQEENITKLQPS